MSEEPIHVLSLGAGVQSSVMALMAARGEITPMPVAAIFADTAEPQSVYDWLDWLETQLPFPVHRIKEKKGLLHHVENGIANEKFIGVPFYSKGDVDGVGRRQCTREYKVTPIARKLRELVGLKPRQRSGGVVLARLSIGISWDEMARQKESRDSFYEHRWPLLELQMKRHDCLRWMEKNKYPKPPRSACWFCPYHSNKEWRHMKDEEPEFFAKAVDMDKRLRNTGRDGSEIYVHPTRGPLGEVDLSTDVERGQGVLDLFQNDCEGYCGC